MFGRAIIRLGIGPHSSFNNFCSAKAGKMYETGRAFTCLLLKVSVANDVINVSLFAYDKIALKT